MPPRAATRNPLTQPLSVEDVERGWRGLVTLSDRLFGALSLPLFLLALLYAVGDAWSRRVPPVAARHRAESLAFQLALPPRLAPPMEVSIGASVIRGRAAPTAAPEEALRQAMRYDDSMVLGRQDRHVGDFDVCSLWLSLPGQSGQWLVTGWMEDGDLQVLSLRFALEGSELGDEARTWGERILGRVLVEPNFRAGTYPPARLTLPSGGARLPVLGPKATRS